MKKILIVTIAFVAGNFSNNSFAQVKADDNIKKEVRVENENGVKTITITTTNGGVVLEEKYSGEEAEAKLGELSGTSALREEATREVEVIEENGVRSLTITTTINGQVSQEIYTGEDADRKIEEMELEVSEEDGKLIIKSKTKIEKSTLDQ